MAAEPILIAGKTWTEWLVDQARQAMKDGYPKIGRTYARVAGTRCAREHIIANPFDLELERDLFGEFAGGAAQVTSEEDRRRDIVMRTLPPRDRE